MKLRVLKESDRIINRAKTHYKRKNRGKTDAPTAEEFFKDMKPKDIEQWWINSTGLKSKSNLDEKVFSKDLDGDGKAEVPDDRQGETGAPEVNMDGGLSDKDNDGGTDPASSKEPAEPEVKDEPEAEEVAGDDELAAELAALEEDVGQTIKLRLVREEPLEESYQYKDEDWSEIKWWDPAVRFLIYNNPDGTAPKIEKGMVRLNASVDHQGIGKMHRGQMKYKSWEKNMVKVYVKQPGFKVTGPQKGELDYINHAIRVDGQKIMEPGDGRFIDVAIRPLMLKGIVDKFGSILDYNGKVIAPKWRQWKLSNAGTEKWPDEEDGE